MKRLATLGMALRIGALALGVLGCDALTEPDTRAVADNALAILRSLRGTTGSVYEPGGTDWHRTDGRDSLYIDETERGVRTTGWVFFDDGGTPFDPTDDVVSFRGEKEYLDWNVKHRVWLSVHVWEEDRATEMAVRNETTGDSSCFDLGPVNRPGGIQSGPAYWTDGSQSVDMVMGVHHNETPDDWNDNYSFIEFLLTDPSAAEAGFHVHADFRPNQSGSGEIRQQDGGGLLVATFEWDDFGRGSLVVDGEVYPFRWD